MSRPLVLFNDAARHPMRRMVPPPLVVEIKPERQPLSDRGLFLLTFFAAFMAFSTFLA